MHMKDVKVTNTVNVVVQIPAMVVRKWGLKVGDQLGVHISDDEQSVIIRPQKVRAGSSSDSEG